MAESNDFPIGNEKKIPGLEKIRSLADELWKMKANLPTRLRVSSRWSIHDGRRYQRSFVSV